MNADALRIEILGAHRDRLGECPLWDWRDQSLYWIDTKARLIHALRQGVHHQWESPSEIGSIALTRRGRLVLSLEDGFHLLYPVTGTMRRLAEVVHPTAPMRLNDGRTDRQGRFVAGSMVVGRHEAAGSYYALDRQGHVRTLSKGVALANGTCFSPDGRIFYHADSLAMEVSATVYDPQTGEVGQSRRLIDTRPLGSAPDGATVDAEGRLWVALVQASKVACFSPEGELLREVHTPIPFPTCPCFGGPALDVLYLTSIRDSGNLLKSDHPDAGAMLAIHGLGVKGLPEVLFDDEDLA